MSTTFTHIPIDAETFLDNLGCGFGRVVLFLHENNSVPFREAILDACLHHRVFDQQAESYRTEYLLDIIQATGEPEFYAAQICQALGSDSEEYCCGQLYELAARLAGNGDAEARRMMYDRFGRRAALHDTTGAEAFVALDGLDGYLFVAAQFLRYPLPQEDQWEEAALLETLEEQIGPVKTQQALERAAQNQPELYAYLAEVEEKRAEWRGRRNSRPPTAVPTYDDLRTMIADPKQTTRWQRWRHWAKRLDEGTLIRLAQDLLAETDRVPLLKHLHLFREQAFPLPIDRLLALARARDEDIAEAARWALGRLTDPRIHALALELWEMDEAPIAVTHLLWNNFAPGDYARVERLVTRDMPAIDFHPFAMIVRRLVEANPASEAVPTLQALYERGRCTLCRCSAVELLLRLGPLPPWILAEGRYDADSETRSLVMKALTADAAG